jgi:succinoglycan biosynthesis protein ExoA
MSTLETSRGQPVESAHALETRPSISVVMPIRNEARSIANTLEDLLRQRYARDRFEIIVVDGESTDNTREIVQAFVRKHGNVRLLTNPRHWSSAARNIGVRAARGDLVLIVDGHCAIDSTDYLEELASAFARTRADCLGRPQPLEVSQPSTLQRAIGIARASRLGHHPASRVFATTEQEVPAHSVAVAYRRSVFERVGLFDESFDACEDVELNHRVDLAGMRCVVVPALRVSYHPRATLAGLFRQMQRYGRGRLRLLRKHPETFSPLGFAPALFLLFVAAGPLAAIWSRRAGLFYVVVLSFYVLTTLGYSAVLALKARRWSLCAWLPAVFATLHSGAGIGILIEVPCQLRPRRTGQADSP